MKGGGVARHAPLNKRGGKAAAKQHRSHSCDDYPDVKGITFLFILIRFQKFSFKAILIARHK